MSFQGVEKLFFLACDATDDNEADIKDKEKYFLLRTNIETYNVLVDERNFYDRETVRQQERCLQDKVMIILHNVY